MARKVGSVRVYEIIGKSNGFDLISNPIRHYNFTLLKDPSTFMTIMCSSSSLKDLSALTEIGY